MGLLEEWLAQRGPAVAAALDQQRDAICSAVSSQMAMAFPSLCYDPARPDALAFQQRTFRETPRRFHRLMQVVLQLQTLEVIEREYRWGWPVIARYGVERYQVLMQVRWYFEATRTHVALPSADNVRMNELGTMVLQIVDHVTSDGRIGPTNGVVQRNGFHP